MKSRLRPSGLHARLVLVCTLSDTRVRAPPAWSTSPIEGAEMSRKQNPRAVRRESWRHVIAAGEIAADERGAVAVRLPHEDPKAALRRRDVCDELAVGRDRRLELELCRHGDGRDVGPHRKR